VLFLFNYEEVRSNELIVLPQRQTEIVLKINYRGLFSISVRATKREFHGKDSHCLVFEDDMIKHLHLIGGLRDPPSEFKGMTMIPYGQTLNFWIINALST
jgi:hypothetical protein